MEISFSLGFLKKPAEWVTKKLCLCAYKASDAYYWQYHSIGSSWTALGEHIEYDTQLATIFSNSNPPLSFIAIKAKNVNSFKKLTLNFSAKGPVVSYQDTIVIYDLTETPVIESLPSIPRKSVWVARGGFGTPYQNVDIEVVELLNYDDVNLVEGKKADDSFIPMYHELLDSEFVSRWDYYWNVDQINWQKQRTIDYLYMQLLSQVYPPWRPLSAWHPRSILFWILTNKFSLGAVFWSQNLVNGKQIRNAIREQNDEINRLTTQKEIT